MRWRKDFPQRPTPELPNIWLLRFHSQLTFSSKPSAVLGCLIAEIACAIEH